jgi:hypothetical protein
MAPALEPITHPDESTTAQGDTIMSPNRRDVVRGGGGDGEDAAVAPTQIDAAPPTVAPATSREWERERTITGTITLDLDGQAVTGDVEFVRWNDGAWTMAVGQDGEGSCEAMMYVRADDYHTAGYVLGALFCTLREATDIRTLYPDG